tara:strand:- start:356 stop:595 length:240 start_codon:yes stop_codon:yes gene_type:complete
MVKYLLVLYMCSMASGECPSSTVAGYQFPTYYDCVDSGYAIAQKTYRNLKELPEWDKPDFEKNQIVIKFECKRIETENT